jgi:hypothetical protein
MCTSPLLFNFKLFFSSFLFLCGSCLPCLTLDSPFSLCRSLSLFNSKPFFFLQIICRLHHLTLKPLFSFVFLCAFVVQLKTPFPSLFLCAPSLFNSNPPFLYARHHFGHLVLKAPSIFYFLLSLDSLLKLTTSSINKICPLSFGSIVIIIQKCHCHLHGM